MTGPRALAAACALVAAFGPRPAAADDRVAASLREAAAALSAGDHPRAAALAGPFTGAPGVDRADRSQAWRIYGLALFAGGRLADAEAAILAHLELEPDAHLDPAAHPPEMIVFFEDVRARHAAELAGKRMRPDTVREKAKNWFPPWGQVQNGHRGKALFIGVTGLLLIAANVTSAVLLYRWCNEGNGVCQSGGESRRDEAIQLRRLNIATVPLGLLLYAYGVWDGYRHHGSSAERSYISLGVDPSGAGAQAAMTWSF